MTKWALLPDSIQTLPDRVTQSLNLVILYGPPYRLYKSWNRPCRTFSSRGTPRWAWPGSPPAADRAPGSPRSWRQSNLTLICKNVFQKRFSLRLTKLVKRFFFTSVSNRCPCWGRDSLHRRTRPRSKSSSNCRGRPWGNSKCDWRLAVCA